MSLISKPMPKADRSGRAARARPLLFLNDSLIPEPRVGCRGVYPIRSISRVAACLVLSLVAFVSPLEAIDLGTAEVTRLDNGLTLIVLQDSTFPVVSVQVLYRVGARHEPVGQTGIAHFLEHMAFRDTENFPDTDVVSRIYAVGGEWHGYTWLDQTTYFETLPAEHLDLALRIEADRMARLLIPADQVEPERGAILAEMHGYENDPSSVLHDEVLKMSFLQHPYRNNTIGWQSDVESITHAEIVRFYESFYQPSNAVLVVVGDVSRRQVEDRVTALFATLPAGTPAVPPPTVEQSQAGIRRLVLEGAGSRSHFKVAYRAPAVTDPDYVAFLVLQEVLAGGSGVNFSQNEWGDPVRPGSRMAGVLDDLTTWFIPTAAPYVFTIAGTLDAGASTEETEARIEAIVQSVRERLASRQELEDAKRHLLRELVFDVETTEAAAHQLAYFEGLDAMGVLQGLPSTIQEVGAEDLQRVAKTYLRPEQRTVGWFLAGPASEREYGSEDTPQQRVEWVPPGSGSAQTKRPSAPGLSKLRSGLPVLFQRVPFSRTAYLRILLPTTDVEIGGHSRKNDPFWRQTSLDFRFEPGDLEANLERASSLLTAARTESAASGIDATRGPEARLEAELDKLLGAVPVPSGVGAAAVALVGDLDEEWARERLEAVLGSVPVAPRPESPLLSLAERSRVVELGFPVAQAQLGYVVPAPPPSDPDSWAWRMLLYVLSHGYEGRLGKEAISRQGLVYYIDSAYESDGSVARVALKIGVDPGKLEAMRALLEGELQNLQSRPPTEEELNEAKQHLVGRRQSAAQSNEEISAALLSEWIGHGRLLSSEEFATAVGEVPRDAVLRIIPEFAAGAVVEVRGRP